MRYGSYPAPDITYQTLYSELVQLSLDESFTSEFSSNGRFVAVESKARSIGISTRPSPRAAPRIAVTLVPLTIAKSPKGSRRSRGLKADLKGHRRLVSTLT